MTDYDTEIREIDRITRELYSTVSFDKGRQPDLEKLKRLFISEGKLINNNGDSPLIMTVPQFIEAVNQQLAGGALKSFYEGEIAGRTELFGKIAHRFSTYEAKFDLSAPEPFCIGINSIQFIKTNDTWRVTSMVWNDQTDTLKIPNNYL